MITVVAVVVLALVGGVLAGVMLSDDSDDEADVELATSEEGEIFLDPVEGNNGYDPFTDSVGRTAPPPAASVTTTTPAASGGAVQAVQASRPGLYGGTRSETSCDRVQLVSFLEQDRRLGEAWADVLGIELAEISSYVDTLTPVLLRQDTRVTNHGYRDGRATRIQSVLQAGTAVLVDRYGEPVVRCYCGNPLREPAALRRPRYSGPEWTTFSPATITVVRRTTVIIEEFVLVDWTTGQLFNRRAGTDGSFDTEAEGTPTTETTLPVQPGPAPAPPPGGPAEPGLGSGDVQVTLRWDADVDLDLSVTDPTGETVSYTSTSVSSGGQLDVDRRCDGGGSPVENVFWPTGGAPQGQYVVNVNYFGECTGGGPVGFTVTATVNGRVVDTVQGTLSVNESREVMRFNR